jgi:hypothetical protein
MFSIPQEMILPLALMCELLAGVVIGYLFFYRA